MKELEIKEMMARHRQELAEKDTTIISVSYTTLQLLAAVTEITFRFAAALRTLDGVGFNCPILPQLEEANRTLTNDVANLANEKEELNNKLKEAQDCKLPRSNTNLYIIILCYIILYYIIIIIIILLGRLGEGV